MTTPNCVTQYNNSEEVTATISRGADVVYLQRAPLSFIFHPTSTSLHLLMGNLTQREYIPQSEIKSRVFIAL